MISTERMPQVVDRAGGRECLDFIFVPEPHSAIADLLGDLSGSANVDAMAETGGHTSRFTARFEPLYTEGALLRHPLLVVKPYHAERTRLDTHHAAGARVLVDQNHAIISLSDSVFWTGLCAARLTAMHTVRNHVSELRFAPRVPRGILVNAYPVRANRKVVLLLASDFAGMTANTGGTVHNKRIFLDHYFSSSAREILHSRTLRLVAPTAGSWPCTSFSVRMLELDSLHP